MQVPLAQLSVGLSDPRPTRAAESTEPIVRWQLARIALTVAEYVSRSLWAAGFRSQRRLEPLMLAGGVVRDEVDDDPDAVVMSRRDELVGILEPAEHRIDIAIVGDVVA